MSYQNIQPYEPPRPVDPLAGPHGPAEGHTQGIGPLVHALGRHWKTVLVLWLLLAPVGAAAVWMRVKPTYTATALVEVAPIVPAILYEQEERPMPLFETYLNTQTQTIASQQVLTAALADPTLQGLLLLKGTDPVAELRNRLAIKVIPKTHLMEVGVTQDNPDSAILLAKALVGAYMSRAAGADQETERSTRQVLEKEREQMRLKLDQQSTEIRKLAEAYGTSSDKMFEILRESVEKYSLETKQELERADLEIYQIQEQIKQLENGSPPTSQPQDWYNQRQQAIDNDIGVRLMRQELEKEQGKFSRLRAVLGNDHDEVKTSRQKVEHLQNQLADERHRAAADVDKEFALRHREGLEAAKARMNDALTMAQRRRKVLKDRVDERKTESMDIGRQGLEIQTLREQRELTKQDYERVVERLKRMEIESQRPTRISLASAPEIRPDGVVDKRLKMVAMAIVGSLFVALAAGLVKDRLDPHVHSLQQVETGTGLRLLGAVPSLGDLQTGRITKEHYLESFRVIRAGLAAGAGGNSPPKSILVTSAQAGEGKTSLAVSLAVSLTESGKRVLLVDGDIQVPQIGKLLKLMPAHDLKGVLLRKRSVVDSAVASGVAGLDVLAGHSNGDSARGALNVQSATELVKEAAGQYDYIIVDSPPALGAADALFWAHAVDGVIVTSLVGHSDRHAIKIACQRLASVGAKLLGSVIANVSVTESYYSYSASSYRSSDVGSPVGAGLKRTPPLVYLPGDDSSPDSPQG